MKLLIKKLHSEAIIPTRAYSTDSGLDIYALLSEDVVLKPLERKGIPTGIAVGLPKELALQDNVIHTVWEMQVRPKSGRALKEGLSILNSPGTIDNSYTGEIIVIAVNLSNENITIKNKQKIAQLVISPVAILPIELVESDLTGDRQTSGLGSTGI